MSRLARLVAAAGCTAVLLSGCAQVPTDGPVVEVDHSVPEIGSSRFVRALARPPRDGMSQDEVVRGFLDAASGFEDSHAVARQYLTPEVARRWNPEAGVRVYGNDTETLTDIRENTVRMTAAEVAVISDRSQYVPIDPGSVLTQDFELVQQGGQWRISSAPEGLLLSRAAVERSYREFQTYFIARPGGILAPSPVLFASSQREVTDDLVRSLLAGPGSWLDPAVISGFPPGTQLNSTSVTDGIARIDLTAPAAQADDLAREQLSAQLVWTMRQVAGVRAVVITVDGQPLPVPGVDPVQPRTAWADFDPDGLPAGAPWYLTRSGTVLAVDATNVPVPVAGAAGVGRPRVARPLVSLDQTAVAATDPSGQLLTAQLEPGSRWTRALTDGRSSGGSWDRTGLLWLPEANGVQAVNALGTQKVRVRLDQVRSVQIARDGSRALVVAGPKDSAAAYLLRVDRTTGPPRLTRPRLVDAGPVLAGVWVNATQVALLIKQPDQPAQVATVDLGLFSVQPLAGPPRARTVAAAPNRLLLSGTADGQIWQFNGTTWVPLAAGRQPRYPG